MRNKLLKNFSYNSLKVSKFNFRKYKNVRCFSIFVDVCAHYDIMMTFTEKIMYNF